MENYENNPNMQEFEDCQPEEPVVPEQIPPVSEPYSGAGVGRKESPFADSPYVMNHQPNPNQYRCGSTYVPPIPPQAPEKPDKPRKPGAAKVWKRVLCAVLAVAVVAGACGITVAVVNNRWENRMDSFEDSVEVRLEKMQKELDIAKVTMGGGNSVSGTVGSGEGMTPGQVYAQNVQSVVLITCEVSTNAFGQVSKGNSFGSGFILSSDGYVATNAHVVENASAIKVTTHNDEVLEAKLIGKDTTNDVAVLKVEAENLPAVVLGSSDDLIVGDQVVAIGNPLGGLTSTMTVGYVSAKDRDVTTEGTTINMIQTDAAINSGNSGGPLFNMKGEVVGITTAKYSGNSGSGASIESIGFAIPIDDVAGMMRDLMDYGYVTGAYLGVYVKDVPSDLAQYYRMPMGARVEEVTPGYCAESAGVKVGDISVKLGGHDVESVTDLTRALRKFKAGDTTEIVVFRSGAEVTLSITLDEKPNETETAAEPGKMPENGSYDEWRKYFFGDQD